MLSTMNLRDFTNDLASNSPAPGGGSVAALSAALASSLTSMVFNLTIGKKVYNNYDEEIKTKIKENLECVTKLKDDFIASMEEDAKVFMELMSAFKLPKETEEQIAERARAIEDATKEAAIVPMQVAEEIASVMETVIYVAHKGNRNAVTDACVAMMTARTCVLGALLNVRINLASIKDEAFVKQMKVKADHLESEAIRIETKLLDWVKTIV